LNKERRKTIEAIITGLDELKCQIEDAHSEEEEYLENMPEGLQAGAKGEAAQNAMTEMENATDSIQEAIDALNTAIQ